MSYITYSEFSDISHTNLNEDDFNKYLSKAEVVLNNVTQNFYQFNNIENDEVLFRQNAFKKALIAQIEFFEAFKSTAFHDLSDIPQSFSVGRTSITNADGRTKGKSESTTIVSDDVYLYLEGTGLLYRGAI